MNKKTDSQITTVDIKKFLYSVLSNWYLFVISLVVSYAYVYIKNKYVITEYGVNTTIMIKQEGRSTESVVGGLQLFNQNKNLQNEMKLMKSSLLVSRAMKELDFSFSYFLKGRFTDAELYRNSPFIAIPDTINGMPDYLRISIMIDNPESYTITNIGETETKIKMKFGQVYAAGGVNFLLKSVPEHIGEGVGKKYYFYKQDHNSLTNAYKSRLNIQIYADNSSILWLWMQGPVPAKDADFLNKVVELYIKMDLEEKNHIAINTIRFIDNQLGGVEDSLSRAENNLQNYRMSTQILNIPDESKKLYEELEAIQTEKTGVITKTRYYQYMLKEIKEKNNLDGIVAPSNIGINDPFLFNQVTKLIELYNQRDIMNYSIKGNIAAMDVLNIKTQKTRDALIQNLTKTLEGTEFTLNDLDKRFSDVMKQMASLPENERRMLGFQRKFTLNDNLYTFLLQRRAEAGMTKASNQTDIKVLDQADASSATVMHSNRSNTSTSIILGLIIPLILVIVKDYFNIIIRDRSDIESKVDVPVISSIGHNEKLQKIPVYTSPKSIISESFRVLRTNLQYLLIEKNQKVVLITSTVSGEGKTFCAVNLASIIAMSNNKTLLVGLDLRKPQIQKIFGLNSDIGMSTYLIQKNTFEEIVTATHIEGLDIVLSGPIPPNPAELIETKHMNEFFEEARKRYDYIIVDTAPVALVTDALLLTKYVDANIYVVRQDYSNKNVLKLITELHQHKSVENLSILLNDVRISTNYGSKYGYRYGYRYGYGYGYGYGNGYQNGYYGEDDKDQRKWYDKIFKFFKP